MWSFDTIGIYGSVLFDVAIIDENDIWAVGEIYTENDQYNAAHWDGEKWVLTKIGSSAYPRRTVFAFGKNDVWFDGTIKWDGIEYSVHKKNFPLLPNGDGWYRNAMWGISSEDFYVVGNQGMIAHYDGQSWQRLKINSTVNLYDIWGSVNGETVWACGYKETQQGIEETALVKIYESAAQIVYKDNIYLWQLRPDSLCGLLTSLWTDNDSQLYVMSTYGMFATPFSTKGEAKRYWYDTNLLPHFPRRIRGIAQNDIFIVGDSHFVAHFNGKNWFYFKELQRGARLKGLSYIDNMMIAVGVEYSTGKAIITIGKRK